MATSTGRWVGTRWFRWAGAACALALAGCGGPAGGTYSCTIHETVSGASVEVCVEYTGLTSDQVNTFQGQCSGSAVADLGLSLTINYTWAGSACSRTNVVGGCRLGSGAFSQTQWYYGGPGVTTDFAKTLCGYSKGTWVAP